MRIKYDSNGFIWEASTDENHLNTTDGYSQEIVFQCCELNDILYDNGLPKNKYINNSVIKITDPLDYQVDIKLWRLYKDKFAREVRALLSSKTNAEIKIIYDNAPDYQKEMIVDGIESYWGDEISQYRMNLGFEMPLRILFEILYIREVEERSLTTDEQAAYHSLLQKFRDHSTALQRPLTADNWGLLFTEWVLSKADDVRFNYAIPQRYQIAGY